MRRLGHTLSSKTQLVANDTTFSASGPGLRLQTRGHNGLNYGLNGYASQSTNKDTHTQMHAHTHQICSVHELNLFKHYVMHVHFRVQHAVIKQCLSHHNVNTFIGWIVDAPPTFDNLLSCCKSSPE